MNLKKPNRFQRNLAPSFMDSEQCLFNLLIQPIGHSCASSNWIMMEIVAVDAALLLSSFPILVGTHCRFTTATKDRLTMPVRMAEKLSA